MVGIYMRCGRHREIESKSECVDESVTSSCYMKDFLCLNLTGY